MGKLSDLPIVEDPRPIADQIAAMEPELMKAALHWHDGRRADAEDLCQDTLLRALRYKHKFQLGTNLKAWLLTIMRHTFYDKRQKVVTESLDKILSDGDSDSDGGGTTLLGALQAPDDTAAAAIAGASVGETMDTIEEDMPPYYEKVVRLVFVEGCTYAEAAEELRIPLGTAMSAVFRARKRLKSLDDLRVA